MSNRRILSLLIVLALCACEPITAPRGGAAPRPQPSQPSNPTASTRLDTPVNVDELVSLMTGSFSSAAQAASVIAEMSGT